MQVYDYYKEKSRSKKWYKLIIIGAILLLILLGIIANSFYLEYLQYREIGENYTIVYIKGLIYKTILFVAGFCIVFLVTAADIKFIKRNLNKYYRQNEIEPRKLLNLPIAAAAGILGGLALKEALFDKLLSFLNVSRFNYNDPVFNLDIGYYIFQRPFLMSLYGFLAGLWIFIILGTAIYYLAGLAISGEYISFSSLKDKRIIRHEIINLAVYFVIKAASYWLVKQNILYGTILTEKGADYVDVNVWLPYYNIIPFILIAIIFTAMFFVWKNKLKNAAFAIAVYPALWIVANIIAIAVQGLVVTPNEQTTQSPYLKYNIASTRSAYSLDKIKMLQFPDTEELTPEIIAKNLETKNNIRVIDINSTLETDKQLQSNTNFYTFNDGDILNYTINGKEIPVFITAREIDKNKLTNRNYINLTYKYTHGYGVVINPINRLTAEGQAGYILSDLKLKSADQELKITRPEIYYGELTKDHVIVNSGLEEIDYDGTATTRYNGQGGIKLDFLNKLLFSIKYGDFRMLISSYSNNATLLLNREVIGRAQKPVPFLIIDQDPYIVVTDDGRLKWVIDAYTASEYFPYAESIAGTNINYIRNSVKVIIDAYDGNAEYYIIDDTDPIINTYDKIYPGIFKREPLPEDIRKHLRYPELLFKIQTEFLKRYHLKPDEVDAFFSNHDAWNIARYSPVKDSQNLTEIEPYYNMIKLPGGVGEKEELILMRPFTPAGEQKHNMVSWLAVRNSAEHYGEMMLFTFPKNTNIFGPNQVEVKINQIDKISEDMTLWGQSGSDVYKGDLLVIPIENSILYVEPIYIRDNGNSSIPQVREIVAGYQSGDEFRYGIGTNLDAALNELFSKYPGTTGGQTGNDGTGGQNGDGTSGTSAGGSDGTGNTGGTGGQNGTGVPGMQDQKTLRQIIEKYNELKKQLDELGSLIEQLR